MNNDAQSTKTPESNSESIGMWLPIKRHKMFGRRHAQQIDYQCSICHETITAYADDEKGQYYTPTKCPGCSHNMIIL